MSHVFPSMRRMWTPLWRWMDVHFSPWEFIFSENRSLVSHPVTTLHCPKQDSADLCLSKQETDGKSGKVGKGGGSGNARNATKNKVHTIGIRSIKIKLTHKQNRYLLKSFTDKRGTQTSWDFWDCEWHYATKKTHARIRSKKVNW